MQSKLLSDKPNKGPKPDLNKSVVGFIGHRLYKGDWDCRDNVFLTPVCNQAINTLHFEEIFELLKCFDYSMKDVVPPKQEITDRNCCLSIFNFFCGPIAPEWNDERYYQHVMLLTAFGIRGAQCAAERTVAPEDAKNLLDIINNSTYMKDNSEMKNFMQVLENAKARIKITPFTLN